MHTGYSREERLLAIGQTHQLMASLATNADWGNIPGPAIQELIRDPVRAGELFSAFVAQGLSAAQANESSSRAGAHVPHFSREEEGGYSANMISLGWGGVEWSVWCREHGYRLLDSVEDILRSDKFRPTPAGTVRRIAILADDDRFGDAWNMPAINAKAQGYGFLPADLETAFLFRKSFSHKELEAMGSTWFVAAHPPLDSEGSQLVVGTNEGGRWIGLASPMPNGLWPHYSSFIYNRKPLK